jgi:hypothetical protein
MHLTIKTIPMVNKRDVEVFIVCWSCHFDVGCSMSSGKRYPIGVLDDTCMLTMTRTCLGPKSSSMRFGYSYFTGNEIFNL